MSALCLAGLLLCFTPLARSQECSDYGSGHAAFKWTGTEPLALLTEYNPWAMVVGSDSPTFALYVDGTVIYWQGDNRSGKYVTAHLSGSQISDLLKATRLDKLDQFKTCYSIFDGTDAPTNVLVVKTSSGFKSIEVYGQIRDMDKVPDTKIPTDLRAALQKLLTFAVEDATPWQPRYFQVILWPFTYAKSNASWPSNFPGISDQNTQSRRDGYWLFLPIADLSQYQSFVAKLQPTQAVLLDGRKWAISSRLPFPHEGMPQDLNRK